LAQGEGEVVRRSAVDIADEAEREMIVLRIDPACAGEAGTKQRQACGDALRNLDGGEESRHGGRLASIGRHSRAGVRLVKMDLIDVLKQIVRNLEIGCGDVSLELLRARSTMIVLVINGRERAKAIAICAGSRPCFRASAT